MGSRLKPSRTLPLKRSSAPRPMSGEVAAAMAASKRRGREFIRCLRCGCYALPATPVESGELDPRPRRASATLVVFMLAQFVAVALTFPTIVYTVLLLVSFLYWLFVMSGA